MKHLFQTLGALALSLSLATPLHAQQDMGEMKDMKDMPGMEHKHE